MDANTLNPIAKPAIPPLEDFSPGLRPTGFNVLVGLPPKQKQVGNVWLPDSAAEKERIIEVRGRIVAMSPAAFDFASFPTDQIPKVGNAVVFAKLSGILTEGEDGKEYRLLQDKEICAVIEENSDA